LSKHKETQFHTSFLNRYKTIKRGDLPFLKVVKLVRFYPLILPIIALFERWNRKKEAF